MVSDGSKQHSEDEKKEVKEDTGQAQHPLLFLPSPMQLQNIFAVEIIARRFPVAMPNAINTLSNLSLEDMQVFQESLQAQVVLNVRVEIKDEPRPFEISFKLVGIFTYTPESNLETIRQFLEQGSMGIMLPFARELLLSLCIRLQVPSLILNMVQVISPPTSETEKVDAPE